MKILITGGAGFIGSHLSDALLAAGHEITIIDDLSSGTKDFLPKEAEFLKMDIRDEKLTDIFKERHFDIIYHEAAQTMVPASIDNPYFFYIWIVNKIDSVIQTLDGIVADLNS